MKAQDKIFIDEDLIAYHCLTDRHDGDLEYIRKDALLEWAREKAEFYKGTANIRRSFEMMIRKIESL